MATTQGSGSAFSTDPHLNDSINDVLSGFVDDAANGAVSPPTQDGSQVESPREIPAPSPGDSGHASAPAVSPDAPTAPAGSNAPADGKSPPPVADEPDPPTEPFSYTVNGEAKTIAEFVRIPGEGVFVPEAQVPRFQQIASRAEANETALRAVHDERQALERLTTWPVYSGINQQTGKPIYTELTGAKALEARQVALSTAAGRSHYYEQALETLTDPVKFQSFFQVVQGDDNQTYVVPNKAAFDDLKERASFAGEKAAMVGRQRFAEVANAPPPPPPETPVSELAMPTIEDFANKHQITGLTPADKQFLAAQFDRYVVMTDRGRAVDPRFLDAMKDRAQRNAEHARAVTTSSVIDRFNRGQDQGRAGQRPVAPPAAPIPQPQPDTRKRRSRNERTGPTFDEILARGMADPDVQAALAGTG